jgi:hypothetical protein
MTPRPKSIVESYRILWITKTASQSRMLRVHIAIKMMALSLNSWEMPTFIECLRDFPQVMPPGTLETTESTR